MKRELSPAAAAALIAVGVLIVVALGWIFLGGGLPTGMHSTQPSNRSLAPTNSAPAGSGAQKANV